MLIAYICIMKPTKKTMPKKETVYEIAGFKDRREYLEFLADEYGDDVHAIAERLGEDEDFDGLVDAIDAILKITK